MGPSVPPCLSLQQTSWQSQQRSWRNVNSKCVQAAFTLPDGSPGSAAPGEGKRYITVLGFSFPLSVPERLVPTSEGRCQYVPSI